MRDPIKPTRCARQLSALAAPARIRIVRLLGDGPRNVSAIAAALRTSLVNVSHHLGVLRAAGIVRGRKDGRFVVYALAPGFLQPGDGPAGTQYLDLGCCRLEVPPPGCNGKAAPPPPAR